MIELDLMSRQELLQTKRQGARQLIFDPIRRKWLVLQPEELVRQLLLQYFLMEKGYSKNRVALEKELIINGMQKRFDILLYDTDTRPLLLAECKAPHVSLSDATFRQIATYNLPLQVPYLLVTNGIVTYCCQMHYEQESYTFLTEVPAS
ncbi:MAG TPA: type I restriction enzyme HsdR N-terminal domain-containing protein [Saprospiraceae bacterium]|nr:type I restriction enzyme HsdR N-terminal domain-containing protein [Saprospiraceae bacterium]HMP25759.1 type I restriction enzyme HsdR N-terminal domain-containing protein [Saprospiraceae bacterium]